MDIGFSTQLLVFLFYFHTITRLHELDGLLILMGMNNRSISWRIRSKFCSLLFLGCWLAGYPYLLFLLMGYWRKHKMRWEERNDKGKRMGRPWITFYSLDVETIWRLFFSLFQWNDTTSMAGCGNNLLRRIRQFIVFFFFFSSSFSIVWVFWWCVVYWQRLFGSERPLLNFVFTLMELDERRISIMNRKGDASAYFAPVIFLCLSLLAVNVAVCAQGMCVWCVGCVMCWIREPDTGPWGTCATYMYL